MRAQRTSERERGPVAVPMSFSLPGNRALSPPTPEPMDWVQYRRRLDYLDSPQSVAGFRKMQQDLRPRHDDLGTIT